jgi:hypothetical protein
LYKNIGIKKPTPVICSTCYKYLIFRTLIDDALNGKFLSSNGMDGFMLTSLCSGMGPSNFFDVLVQSLLMGVFRQTP